MIERCAAEGVNPGLSARADYRAPDGLLVAITEQRSRQDIDRLAAVLGAARRGAPAARDEHECPHRATRPRCTETAACSATARRRSSEGAPGPARVHPAAARRARAPLDELLPARLRRAEPPRLPEVSEPEIVRHYIAAVDAQLRPRLGLLPARLVHDEAQPASCTSASRRCRATPACTRSRTRPRAGRARADVGAPAARSPRSPACRTSRCSRAPARHGELAGVLLTRAYHEARGEHAHEGAHARHRARHEPGDGDDGRLRGRQGRHERRTAASTSTTCEAKATDDVACLMLTNPNTLGLFDPNIEEITSIVHGVGATLYYDGANLNAMMGITPPGRHGLRHRALQPAQDVHPAARRRRARARVRSRCRDRIEPFLPMPVVVRAEAQRHGPVRAGLRPPAVDRAPARLPGQLRRLRALLRLHLLARRRRAAARRPRPRC